MCSVNDKKRKQYDDQINSLNSEKSIEESKLNDIKTSKEELQQLVNEAQCAIDNLSNCDFGGDRIISSVTNSQKGYLDKIDYYDEYMLKCQSAIDEISSEIEEVTKLRDSLPKDCGSCSECIAMFEKD